MAWNDWLLFGVVVFLFCGRAIASAVPPHWWYASPSKRRAMRLAVQAAAQLHQATIDGSGCWVVRKDPEKCFVFLQQKGLVQPPVYFVFVVWLASSRVDDLGGWQFHWGLFWPDQPIEAYERCRAAGHPWPVGLCEWVQWSGPLKSENGEIL